MSIDKSNNISEKQEPSIIDKLKSDSYLLAITPFLGSFLAFIFEVGYLQFYEVPITLIQLDLTRIITASGYIALGLTVLVILFELAINIREKGNHPLYKIISHTLFICILISSFLVLIPNRPEKWWLIVAVIGYQVVYKLVFIEPKRSLSDNYWDRVSLTISSDEHETKKNTSKSTIEYKEILSFILFGSLWVYLLGMNYAAEKTIYWALDDQPDMILVTNYGETLIFKKITLSTHEITDYIEIHKINESAPIKLSFSQIGKLKRQNRNVQQ